MKIIEMTEASPARQIAEMVKEAHREGLALTADRVTVRACGLAIDGIDADAWFSRAQA